MAVSLHFSRDELTDGQQLHGKCWWYVCGLFKEFLATVNQSYK